HVEQAQALARRRVQPVDADEEGGERLARAGRRLHEHVRAGRDRRPGPLLGRRRPREGALEPGPRPRREGGERVCHGGRVAPPRPAAAPAPGRGRACPVDTSAAAAGRCGRAADAASRAVRGTAPLAETGARADAMPRPAPRVSSRFDVVVAGGGTAGCILAARLSEAPERTVCLLEAGPDYGPLADGRWPAEMLDAPAMPFTHDWGTGGEDERSLGARILGGSSA